MFYRIDLATSTEVYEYDNDTVQKDLDHYNASHWMDLIDHDWKVFKTETDANKFVTQYNQTLKRLNKLKTSVNLKGLPCLLYKRRYLVLSALGLKLVTKRDYLKKNLLPGDLFYFHDQTYYLICELKKITKNKEGLYEYEFIVSNQDS